MTRFQKICFLHVILMLSMCVAARAQDPFETNTRLGLFADPEGTQPCISIPQGEIGRIYLVATTAGQSAAGFTGAEFRIEWSNADGYILNYEAPQEAVIVIGDPFDYGDNDSTAVGVNVAFGECQSVTGLAGDKIDLGSILVVNVSGGPTSLQIKRRSPPSNRNLQYPLFNLCDPPVFSATPMGACTSGPQGEVVAAVAFLNDPTCDASTHCVESCDVPPRLRVEGRRTPDKACPGETVTLEAVAWNTGSEPETISFFVNGQPDVEFENVAPGDSVRSQRQFLLEDCAVGVGYVFGVVAQTASCPLTAGREVYMETSCRASECDDGTDGCASIFLSAPWKTPAGQEFDVSLHIGNGPDTRARNVFGISGRLHYRRPDLLQFVEFTCEDAEGNPLSMGPDAICFASVDANAGYIDFAVTRKRGDHGLFGNLEVARFVFRFPEELGGGFCSELQISELQLINPLGNALCFEFDSWFGGNICSASPCRVWPGDTNRDGMIDGLDLQTMAGFWGEEGPARERQYCGWGGMAVQIPPGPAGYEVDCWQEADASWSDASGNGRVGAEDVLCVGLNWGRQYESPFEPIPESAGQSLVRKQAYEQMLAYVNTMDSEEPGMAETRDALRQLLAELPVPRVAGLLQNVPNPFNPNTSIGYHMAAAGRARIDVYDVMGRHVRQLVDEFKEPGQYATTWDGRRSSGEAVASGIYYYRATLAGETFARKMVLMR